MVLSNPSRPRPAVPRLKQPFPPGRPDGKDGAFRVLRWRNLYDGIDLVLRSSPEGLKYDLVLAPGADLSRLRFEIAGDVAAFEAQARTIFALIDRTLARAGGTLANLVTMTVFINDPRNGDRFVQIRNEHFTDGRYPGSALVTVSNFARPGCVIEIQGIAVV